MNELDWTYVKPIDAHPLVQEHEIGLFKINLSHLFENIDSSKIPYLSTEEQIKLSKFKFNKDRIRYGIGRFVLKLLLSKCIDLRPDVINLSIGKYGKPFFEHYKDYKFNLSHSGDLLLVGLCLKHELGVDVEVYNRNINHLEIAESVFSTREQYTLRTLAGEKRVEAFYNCWSLKESFIKALGLGLQIPLNQFSMWFFNRENKSNLLDCPYNPVLVKQVKSKVFNIDLNYSAAYTCDSSLKEVKYFDYTELVIHQLNLNKNSSTHIR